MNTEMKLNDEPFEKIKSGQKTVEIRLYDEKRRKLNVGDTVTFSRASGKSGKITAQIVALHPFETFKDLFLSDLFPKTGSGSLSPEQAAESMYKYYPDEREKLYGVLGIEIKVL